MSNLVFSRMNTCAYTHTHTHTRPRVWSWAVMDKKWEWPLTLSPPSSLPPFFYLPPPLQYTPPLSHPSILLFWLCFVLFYFTSCFFSVPFCNASVLFVFIYSVSACLSVILNRYFKCHALSCETFMTLMWNVIVNGMITIWFWLPVRISLVRSEKLQSNLAHVWLIWVYHGSYLCLIVGLFHLL